MTSGGAPVPAGLCDACRWQRVIENRRGSRFVMCRRSAFDERLPRYPRLPVLECVGFEPRLGGKEQP